MDKLTHKEYQDFKDSSFFSFKSLKRRFVDEHF
jgi:hypothetical protein